MLLFVVSAVACQNACLVHHGRSLSLWKHKQHRKNSTSLEAKYKWQMANSKGHKALPLGMLSSPSKLVVVWWNLAEGACPLVLIETQATAEPSCATQTAYNIHQA